MFLVFIFTYRPQLAACEWARPVFRLRMPWLYFYTKTAYIYTTYTLPKFSKKMLDKFGFIMYNDYSKKQEDNKMKLVINTCYGGFGLSDKALSILGVDNWELHDMPRNNAQLVEVVETLGEEADGRHAQLEVVEIPDDATDFCVMDYDGLECVCYVMDGKLRWLHTDR